jgi:phage-related protein
MSLNIVQLFDAYRLASDGAYIILLDIALSGGTTLRICRNTEDITWGGDLYTAFPLELDDVNEDGKELPGLTLKASNVLGVLQGYVEAAGSADADITLRIVNSNHLDQDADHEEYFAASKISFDAQWAKLTLGAENPMSIRIPVSRHMADFCRFVTTTGFKGLECAYAGAGTVCNGTLAECRAFGNSARFGGEPGLARNVYAG